MGRSVELRLGESRYASACLFSGVVGGPGEQDGGPRIRDERHPPDRGDALRRVHQPPGEIRERTWRSTRTCEPRKARPIPGLTKPVKPTPRRHRVDNVTIEALLRIMSQNERGQVAPYDELSTLILSFNQYKGGAGNDQANALNKIWQRRPRPSVHRKSNNEYGEPLRIPHPFVGITGNMTPSLLPQMHSRGLTTASSTAGSTAGPTAGPGCSSHERGAIPPHLIVSWETPGWRLFNRGMEEYEPGKLKPWTVEFSDGGRAAWDCSLRRPQRRRPTGRTSPSRSRARGPSWRSTPRGWPSSWRSCVTPRRGRST